MAYPELSNVAQEHTANKGGPLDKSKVSLFVVHYTAGLSFSGSLSWMKNKDSKASAHFLIGRNGDCVQLVPLSRVSWHAGVSSWHGKPNCNFYSIGIELDNPGPLAKRADGSYVTVVGSKPVAPEHVHVGDHKAGGPYHAWHTYADAQLTKLSWLLGELRAEFPNVSDIVGHDDISPGRKWDPGPAFPRNLLTRA